MLSLAAVSIGLPLPQWSKLDSWYLNTECGGKPYSSPVPFFPEVHEKLTKTWNAPFLECSLQTSLVALTSLDSGAMVVGVEADRRG